MTDIAKNICEFRKKCGLTQRELSEKVGESIQTDSKWEKGISLPNVNLLPVIASVFEVNQKPGIPNRLKSAERR